MARQARVTLAADPVYWIFRKSDFTQAHCATSRHGILYRVYCILHVTVYFIVHTVYFTSRYTLSCILYTSCHGTIYGAYCIFTSRWRRGGRSDRAAQRNVMYKVHSVDHTMYGRAAEWSSVVKESTVPQAPGTLLRGRLAPQYTIHSYTVYSFGAAALQHTSLEYPALYCTTTRGCAPQSRGAIVTVILVVIVPDTRAHTQRLQIFSPPNSPQTHPDRTP